VRPIEDYQLQALGLTVTIAPAAWPNRSRPGPIAVTGPGRCRTPSWGWSISGQDGGGPGRLALLRRRIWPGPEAAQRPHLGTARPHPGGARDRRQ